MSPYPIGPIRQLTRRVGKREKLILKQKDSSRRIFNTNFGSLRLSSIRRTVYAAFYYTTMCNNDCAHAFEPYVMYLTRLLTRYTTDEREGPTQRDLNGHVHRFSENQKSVQSHITIGGNTYELL